MAVRKVRTAAGVKRYDQPIGSIIVADSVLRSLKVVSSPFKGWTRVKGKDGKEYDIGNDEDANVWVALKPDTWEILVDEGDTEEEVFELLDKAVGNKNKGLDPKKPIIGTAIDKPAKKGADSNAQKTTGTAKKPGAAKKAATTPKKVAKKAPAKKTTPTKKSSASRRDTAKKGSYTVIDPSGNAHTMNSSRTMTHAVVRRNKGSEGYFVNFASSEENANREAGVQTDQRDYVQVVPLKDGGSVDAPATPSGNQPSNKPTTAEMREANNLPYSLQLERYLERRKIGATHDEALRSARDMMLPGDEPQPGTDSDYEPKSPSNSQKVKASDLMKGDRLIIQGNPEQRVELTNVRKFKGATPATGEAPDMIEVTYASRSGGDKRRFRADADTYIVDEPPTTLPKEADYTTWSDSALRRMLATQTLKKTRRRAMEAEMRRRVNQRDLEREIRAEPSESLIAILERMRGTSKLTAGQIRQFDDFTNSELMQRTSALRAKKSQLKAFSETRSRTSAERQRWQVEMREIQDSINQLNTVLRERRSNR